MLARGLRATVQYGSDLVIIKVAPSHEILSHTATNPTCILIRRSFTWLTVGIGCLNGVLHDIATIVHSPSRRHFQNEMPRLHSIWLSYVNMWRRWYRKQNIPIILDGRRIYGNKCVVSLENKQEVQLGHVRKPMRTKQNSPSLSVGAISPFSFSLPVPW